MPHLGGLTGAEQLPVALSSQLIRPSSHEMTDNLA